MMRMLAAGGLMALTDGERGADDDNPGGYFELERVKQTRQDPSWLAGAEGHVVKVISQLLPDLPTDRRFKVVFMRRHLDEVLASQKKMLGHRQAQSLTSDQQMKELFVAHLAEIEAWLEASPHIEVCFVNYGRVLVEPQAIVRRISAFLAVPLDHEAMVGVVDPALYRNRAAV